MSTPKGLTVTSSTIFIEKIKITIDKFSGKLQQKFLYDDNISAYHDYNLIKQ